MGMMLRGKGAGAYGAVLVASAEGLVALKIDKDALFPKIRMSEQSEFGFWGTFFAALTIFSTT